MSTWRGGFSQCVCAPRLAGVETRRPPQSRKHT
jgi:hypothetical protein